jgi:hypothetical protein
VIRSKDRRMAIADFVCPTPATRAAFRPKVRRSSSGSTASRKVASRNQRAVRAAEWHGLRVEAERTPEYWVEEAGKILGPLFGPPRPARPVWSIAISLYQHGRGEPFTCSDGLWAASRSQEPVKGSPFHHGHKALIIEPHPRKHKDLPGRAVHDSARNRTCCASGSGSRR